jgi:hypothetical protein
MAGTRRAPAKGNRLVAFAVPAKVGWRAISSAPADRVARHRPGAGRRESDSIKSVILSKTGLSGRRRRTSHYFARWMRFEE